VVYSLGRKIHKKFCFKSTAGVEDCLPLISKKYLIIELFCFIGIILLLDSASRTLFVLDVGSGNSPYYLGISGAFAPFENLEGILGTILAMNPLFFLAFTRA